jgi:hypothetical protein
MSCPAPPANAKILQSVESVSTNIVVPASVPSLRHSQQRSELS